MIGTGVFTTSGILLSALHTPWAVLACWAIGGLLALCGALSYAELVAAFPGNGGEYHLLSQIYHPAIGFVSGLVSCVVGFAAPIAASALAFAEYSRALFPTLPPKVVATLLVVVLSLIHGSQLHRGRWVQDGLTFFKLLLVVGIVGVGVGSFSLAHLNASSIASAALEASASEGLFQTLRGGAFAVAMVEVGFSYTGWNAAAYVAGELRRPERDVPTSLIAGTLTVTALYLLLNLVFLAGAPPTLLAGEVAVGHVAAVHMFGPYFGRALSATIAFGLVSTVGAFIFTGARVLLAMGRDYRALSLLTRRSRRGAPYIAALVQAGLSVAMVWTASFEQLLLYIGFTLSVFSALTVAGVPLLRIASPDLNRPYRTFLYPLTPLLFLAMMLWVIALSLWERPLVGTAGSATVLLALAVYALVKRADRRLGAGR